MSIRSFRRTRHGVRVGLAVEDRALLARLLGDVDGMLADVERAPVADAATPVSDPDDPFAAWEADLRVPPPADPAVARLLPDASRDDPEAAASYRRLTEEGLRERKRRHLSTAAAALTRPDPVLLSPEEARSLMTALTDVRLVLAERLGLHTDEDAVELHERLAAATRAGAGPGTDPAIGLAAVYEALTWWQEDLISAVAR